MEERNMSATEFSLPEDVPWKRMAVSEDMIATGPAGQSNYPMRWKSSVAVFYHEPTDLPPEYCDRKITYLKVVCTVGNYQYDPDDWDQFDKLVQKYEQFDVWGILNDDVLGSYPCYGALLQIAVYPNPAKGIELYDYPYISSFQPRKREMYEVLTESGEMASQSSNKVNVLKGNTTTDTNEKYNLDLGGSKGGGLLFGIVSGQEADQKQAGTIDKYQDQDQNVTTTDASREKRETHAYSTSLNQLYTLLQGFHLGTNRALFLLQPLPHVQDGKFTFIRGPRRLEGVQEFFLIVNRPVTVPGVCVEVILETAHLYCWRAYKPRLISYPDLFLPGNLEKTAEALGISPDAVPGFEETVLATAWNEAEPDYRFLAKQYEEAKTDWDHVKWYVDLGLTTWQEIANLLKVVRLLPSIDLENVAVIYEEYEADEGQIFVTGRRVAACVKSQVRKIGKDKLADCEQSDESHISKLDKSASVVYVKDHPGNALADTASIRDTTRGLSLNALQQDINETLRSSVGSADRHPYGTMSFLDTEFMLERLAQFLGLLGRAEVRDAPLQEVAELAVWVQKGLGRVSGVKTVTGLANLTTGQLADDLKLAVGEARKARKEILLVALGALDPATVNRDAKLPNPIWDRLTRAFPADVLRRYVLSAHPVGLKRQPKPGWFSRIFGNGAGSGPLPRRK
jgi:hypothetical protein